MEHTMTHLSHPRSQGVIQRGSYTKSSSHNLENETRELERCLQLSLADPHVSPVKIVGYEPSANQLTTEFVEGNSFFNILWNQTSWMRFLGKRSISDEIFGLRAEELGRWLARYHLSGEASEGWDKALEEPEHSFSGKIRDLSEKQLLSQSEIARLRGGSERSSNYHETILSGQSV